MRRVIVITGPIASGKSTVAGGLARELALMGVRAIVIDLDLVYTALTASGSPSDESTWTLARRETARLANAALEDGVAVVIADGSFNLPGHRAALTEQLVNNADVAFVTLTVSFEEALRRARADSTRGRSQDPDFLRTHFDARRDALAAPPETDIVIDTEMMSVTQAAKSIALEAIATVG